MKIDLHCHSTNSDGSYSVKELLEKAEKIGVKGLCISDHDNLNGSIEARKNKKLFSGELVTGFEISTKVKNKTVHLLAYLPTDILPADHFLLETLEKIQTDRQRRMKIMVKKAHDAGFAITYDEVIAEASKGMDGNSQPTDVISKPHFARVFIAKGYAESIDEVFDKYIGENGPYHASRFTLKFLEWIDLIHRVGGIVSWAHPLFGHEGNLESLKIIATELLKHVDAIEYYYKYDGKYPLPYDFEKPGLEYIRNVASENNLLLTAGGDFHGDVGELGGVDLPEEDWIKFKQKLYGK